jgi:hypothetical protein
LLRQLSFAVRDGHVPWLSRFNDVVALDVVNLRSELSAARPEASRERRLRLTTLRADVAVAAAILRTGPHAAHDLSRLNRIAALARAPAD